VGVSGELYLGGEGLARGYLGRPGLTAERFVPDPFSREGGARLYRTGDVVRFLEGGELEFVGRLDGQVKVRGYRIESGEVEAAVRELEGVSECVVVAREDEGAGGKRLVAYVVPAGGDGDVGGAGRWRDSLRRRLPEYMIPSLFVTLDRLPLTANGKVDRRALPAPDSAHLELKKDSVAPRDMLELKLAQIWEEVLGVQPVGVRDEFFEIGGDSLLAVRLMARIQQATGQKIPLQSLITGGTVEHLSGRLRGQAAAASGSSLVRLQASGSKTPFFCVHPVGGGVLSYLELSRGLGAERPFYGLQAQGFDDGRQPLDAVEAMVARYVGEIRAVQPEGPYLLGGWSMGGVIAFEMTRQLQERGQSVALLALLDSRVPTPEEKSAPSERARMLAEFAQDLGMPFERLGIPWAEFAALDSGEQLTFVLERAKESRLVPAYVDLALAEGLFKVYEANVRALYGYDARAQECRVQLFKAAERAGGQDEDAAYGWGDLATQGVEVHRVAGNHYTMMRGPHVAALAEELRARMGRV
jgi:thioesterase domain-containing protein/acyl carrier protein